ncbi:mitotic checkpoint serine/threonine-protein kinase BUB1 beta [Galendromus occidentalis]|uniref:Mitotic checkpoint serine/threonine-protein kinase BUB1 beta n=1 Tax=Galendromus occidentalis TaxID=34638 RepID=A0AAJ6QPQ3_9ACAR|nr:mitotic checkpoint serine/threonine-protein kinase BUB1 beta [Galendromus occidentalis]
MEPQPAWEAAKENIQPLRRGRNIASLTEALQNPEILEEKKREFEEDLRAYDGEDPLHVWDSYLTWLEEHYPSGLHGLHLPQLLENCISTFIPDRKYDNDPRYVRVWLKFAGLQPYPEEVYKCMSARGVGVRSSAFYIEWAEYHELSGESRRAQEILEKGIAMLAEPHDQLKTALKQLILRIAQGSTRNFEAESEDAPQDSRNALSKLRPTGSIEAPNVRVGSNRLALQPGAVQGLASKSGLKNSKMAIYIDENASSGLFSGMGSLAGSSSTAHSIASNKENTKRAEKMARQKIPQRLAASEGPTFDVVQDAESESRNQNKSSTTIVGVLSTRKDSSTHMSLSNVLEGPNINEKRMYDFLKVYGGTCEFQFEEIRFAKYKRKMAASGDATHTTHT